MEKHLRFLEVLSTSGYEIYADTASCSLHGDGLG